MVKDWVLEDGRRSPCCMVGGIALRIALPLWAGETVLPMTPSVWETKVFPEPGSSISGAQAATFSFASDEKLGSCLGVGPWRAGQWGIRGESRQRFANDVCTVRGYYRTEAPATFQATVGVLFYRQKEKLNGHRVLLPPSEKWTPFEFFLRVKHPAADSLTLSLGMAEKGEGKVWFAGVSYSEGVAPLKFPGLEPAPSQGSGQALSRPAPPESFARGKYFRLEVDFRTF